MTPLARRLAVATLCGVASLVSACDATQPDVLVAPASPPAAARAAAVKIVPGPAIGAQAINTVLGPFPGGVLLTVDTIVGVRNYYSFSASRTRKGTATGTFQFVSAYDNASVVLSGTIVCYTVQGSRARVGGVVTSSSFAEIPVGTTETWSITDNGDIGDTGSSLLGGNADYALSYCANGLPYTENAYLSGGVQITR